MYSMRTLYKLTLASCLLLLTACAATTRIDSTWMNPEAESSPYKNVAVLALMNGESQSEQFESQAVAQLEQKGISAEKGHAFLASNKPTDDKKATREQLEKSLQSAGADGILIFKLIAVDENDTYHPPTLYETEGPYYYDWPYYNYYYPYPVFYDYFDSAWQVTSTAGYWQDTQNYVIETSLYDNKTDRLVWTARSNTVDPKDFQALSQSVIKKVTGKLAKFQLIAATQ